VLCLYCSLWNACLLAHPSYLCSVVGWLQSYHNISSSTSSTACHSPGHALGCISLAADKCCLFCLCCHCHRALLLLPLLPLLLLLLLLLQAVKDVSSEVFADAAGVVFNSWCPKASAKLSQMELLTSETLTHIINKKVERCTQKDGNGGDREFIGQILLSNKPFVKNIADALTEAKSCGCKVNRCFWCSAGQEMLNAPATVAAKPTATAAAVPAAAAEAPAAVAAPAAATKPVATVAPKPVATVAAKPAVVISPKLPGAA
jgi:hypothetical protein